ncbi:MAG: DUF2723 domain-containing protein [Candidatus Dadabacteria bacterium]|nr:MAG: DUF2723 domain-containing protein [Candidatus Dadabacteria bacterium]
MFYSVPVKQLFYLIVFTIWALLVFLAPDSTYWRDGAEFILTAFYLDIIHPAGFPLYSQLANLFSLLPLGPIAWRVSLFSNCVFVLLLACVCFFTYYLTSTLKGLSTFSRTALSILAVIITLLLPSLVKQALIPEAYTLNALLTFILVWSYIRFIKTGDFRIYIFSGFIAAMSIANHVSAALPALLFFILTFNAARKKPQAILAALIFGMGGLLTYTYIPIRAKASPSLNSGYVSTAEKLIDFLSDKRDRLLRPARTSTTQARSNLLTALMSDFTTDLRKIAAESSLFLPLLAAAGLLLLGFADLRIAGALCGVAFLNWLFFKRWDPDPWVTLFSVLVILSCYLAGYGLSVVKNYKLQSILSIVFAVGFLGVCFNPIVLGVSSVKNYKIPAQIAEYDLSAADFNSVFVSEACWFIYKYIRDIEGYRDDIVLVYQPSLLFPRFFRRTLLHRRPALFYDSHAHSTAISDSAEADLENLARLVNFTSAGQNSFAFEPNSLLNKYFRPVAQQNPSGLLELYYGKAGFADAEYLRRTSVRLKLLHSSFAYTWPALRADARNFFEIQLINQADLRSRLNGPQAAASLIKQFCSPDDINTCSTAVMNNLAVYLKQAGEHLQAVKLLARLLLHAGGHKSSLRRNFIQFYTRLSASEKKNLQRNREVSSVIKLLGL